MTDIGKEFLKKMFNKTIGQVVETDPLAMKHNDILREVNLEEAIISNKIKLKTMKSITDSMIDKAFNEANLDEFIKSTIQLKVAESIENQAHYIVDEALEDLEESYDLVETIKDSVIDKIKSVFK